MDWDQISEVVSACMRDMCTATAQGKKTFPTGIVFVGGEDQAGLLTIQRRLPIKSRDDLDMFVRIIQRHTPDAQAAGFVAVLPQEVWDGVTGQKSDLLGDSPVTIIHVEHLTEGVRTWMLPRPTADISEWVTCNVGFMTPLPPCIDDRRYGVVAGDA